MVNVLRAFCESPAVIIPNASNCKDGSFCCDNTRTTTQRPRPRPTYPQTTTTHRPFLPTTTQAPDYREECPGSCIVSLLSFTCFRNAEMTDIFKCKKSGTTCCAPKSRIHEMQGMMMHRNDTFPVFVNPQQQIPQFLPNNNYAPNYQQLPSNSYAPIPNTYQQIPQQPAIPNNYQIPPQNNYIAQQPPPPQPIPQTPIISNNNYPVPPQNYPNNIYQQNVVHNPNVVHNQNVVHNPNVHNPNVVHNQNLAPAYTTPGK